MSEFGRIKSLWVFHKIKSGLFVCRYQSWNKSVISKTNVQNYDQIVPCFVSSYFKRFKILFLNEVHPVTPTLTLCAQVLFTPSISVNAYWSPREQWKQMESLQNWLQLYSEVTSFVSIVFQLFFNESCIASVIATLTLRRRWYLVKTSPYLLFCPNR